MAGIKHAFVNASAEGGDATKVRTSNWNADHTIDGPLVMPLEASGGTAPAAGFMKLFARPRAGRSQIVTMGDSGFDYAMQPAIFSNAIFLWVPNITTTVALNYGTSWTTRVAGTAAALITAPAITATNDVTTMNRNQWGTGTTATGSGGVVSTTALAHRGAAAGRGGFFFFCRFALETYLSDQRLIVGLSSVNTALNGQPSAVNNTVGLIKDSGDTVLQLFTRDGTTGTKTATTCTPSATQVLDFAMYASPNSSTVTMRLWDARAGTVYANEVVLNTTLPVNTTFLYANVQIQSVSGLTAKILSLAKIYCEVDL